MNYYAPFRTADVANGEGVRVTLFVSGCRHCCIGCFNDEAWDFNFGEMFTPEVLEQLLDACDKPEIAGLSLLGGEPMEPENQWTVLGIIQAFRDRFGDSKNIWMWTGCELSDFCEANQSKYFVPVCSQAILKEVDVLIDGPYVQSLRDISLKFRGSSNQRILHLKPHEAVVDWVEK